MQPKTQNLKLKTSKSSRRGFTMAELVIATGIFMIIISICVDIFIRSLRAQRVMINLMAINDNASLVIEQMMREMRTGRGFTSISPSAVSFRNTNSQLVTYRWNQSDLSLERMADPPVQGALAVFQPLTSSEVKVRNLAFRLNGEASGDNIPTHVTITMSVGNDFPEIRNVTNNIQTTVTQRNLDR